MSIINSDLSSPGSTQSSRMTMSAKNSMFTEMSRKLGLLSAPSQPGFNDITKVVDESTQTSGSSPLEEVRRTAESLAHDVVLNFVENIKKKPPNKYCKTLRRTVKELSDRHDLVFKGMVNRLKPDEKSAFPTFVTVADEIFDDGQINWGRIVAVYTFAARLAQYNMNTVSSEPVSDFKSERPSSHSERIALFVGKYVASKLGQWIYDHGGWDAFVEYFPDQGDFEEKMWKGMLYTALGLGALATVVATR